MSGFNDAILADVDAVFVMEFAEPVDIDGTTVRAVIDDSLGALALGGKEGFGDASGLGLYAASRVLFVRDDFDACPQPGQRIRLNGELWCVDEDEGSVKNEHGMLQIRMHRAYA